VEASNPFVVTMPQRSIAIYSEALKLAMKLGKCVGLNVLDEDYRPVNVKTMFVYINLSVYSIITIFCCIEFYGNLDKFVFCIVFYGFAIQVRGTVLI
jgi:hypothetical protein